MLACAAVLVLLCVLVCLVPRASCASCSCWWLARACVPAVLRVRGCACVCGPLTACLPCVWVLAWVWAVGRSGGLLWLLVVGCVWRMSSGPVVVGGVARARLCRVCVGGWFWWLWWCPGWGAGVGVHGGGGGAVGGRRDRYPACQVRVWSWSWGGGRCCRGGVSWARLDGGDTPEGVGGVSGTEGIGGVCPTGGRRRMLAVRGDGGRQLSRGRESFWA